MTFDWPTRLKRCASSGLLLLFLANCQSPPPPTPLPSASRPAAGAVPLPLETIRSICLAWFNSQATWQDSDAEQTKNEIDFGYRRQEEVCGKYLTG